MAAIFCRGQGGAARCGGGKKSRRPIEDPLTNESEKDGCIMTVKVEIWGKLGSTIPNVPPDDSFEAMEVNKERDYWRITMDSGTYDWRHCSTVDRIRVTQMSPFVRKPAGPKYDITPIEAEALTEHPNGGEVEPR